MQETRIYCRLPKYTSETDTWSFVEFKTKKDFILFVKAQFKVPGKYNLKNTKNWVIPRNTFKEKEVFDLEEVYRNLLKKNELSGFEVKERFYEIGSFSGLNDTENFLSK